jgi:hypothetical protein
MRMEENNSNNKLILEEKERKSQKMGQCQQSPGISISALHYCLSC